VTVSFSRKAALHGVGLFMQCQLQALRKIERDENELSKRSLGRTEENHEKLPSR